MWGRGGGGRGMGVGGVGERWWERYGGRRSVGEVAGEVWGCGWWGRRVCADGRMREGGVGLVCLDVNRGALHSGGPTPLTCRGEGGG